MTQTVKSDRNREEREKKRGVGMREERKKDWDEMLGIVRRIVSVDKNKETEGVCGEGGRMRGRMLSRWPGSLVPSCFMALTACQ